MGGVWGQYRDVTIPVQSVYAQSESQKYPLGLRLALGDRVFRYAKAGGVALVAGKMNAAVAHVANHVGVTQTAYGMVAGQTVVNVLLTATTPTADQYKDGYLSIDSGTGAGQMYKIKSHTLATTPCVVTLYDPIVTAVADTAEASLVPNKWRSVVAMPLTAVAPAAGVALLAVDIGYFCWLQVKGLVSALVDTGDTLVVGECAGYPATPTVIGGFGNPAVTDQIYGYCWYVAAADKFSVVNLNGLGND